MAKAKESKIKDTIRRGMRPLQVAIVPFSIIMVIASAVLFFVYEKSSEESIKKTALNGVSLVSSDVSRQTTQYLAVQAKNIMSFNSMIEQMDMSEDDVLELILSIDNLDGTFIIVDPKTYEGYETIQDSDGDLTAMEVDYSDVEAITAACQEVLDSYSGTDEESQDQTEESQPEASAESTGETAEETPVHSEKTSSAFFSDTSEILNNYIMTGIFYKASDGTPATALCEKLSIENKELVLMYVLNVEDVLDGTMSSSYLTSASDESEDAEDVMMLVDEEGNFIYRSDNVDTESTNIFDYIDELYGDSTEVEFETELNEYTDGSVVIEADDTYEIYTFCTISALSDSIFITKVDYDSLETVMDIEYSGGSLARLVFLMLIPLALDILLVIFLYSRMSKQKAEIEATNVQLQKANDAQNIFISNMSHELRTPINAVLGMDEMIIRESSEEIIIGYARNIKSAGKSLLGIINNILDFTKMEAGKIDIIDQEYSVGTMINDLRNLVAGRMMEKNLDFVINVDENMPAKLVGDEMRVRQIITNILTNAAKYTEAGSVTFNVGFTKVDNDTITLDVSVKDTGIGMKQEEMDKLYKPFERMDEKRNRTIEGTGLGMSICTRLLNQMGGQLKVESEYGVGSTFAFSVKQGVVSEETLGNIEKYYIAKKDEDEEEKVLHASKARILVVDDTDVNLTVVKGLLKRTGIQVETATGGIECLAMAKETPYDIILLDHRMPEMDGVETLHHLREEEGANKETVVIALTANVASGSGEYYTKEGFNDYLAKPVNGKKLERTIEKYLDPSLIDSEKDLLCMIDEEEGIKISGSQDLYDQVCSDFAKSAERNIAEIKRLYDERDLENLTIKIHAMKSSARLVGAMALSKEALRLEEAGNEKKWDVIDEAIAGLLDSAGVVTGKLKEKYHIADSKDLPEIDEKSLKEILNAMAEFVSVFDFDQLDFCAKNLEAYRMPDDISEDIENLKGAIADVDDAAIKEILNKLL